MNQVGICKSVPATCFIKTAAMKLSLMIFLFFSLLSEVGNGQIYFTRNGFTRFYSKTTFEDIAAENNQVYAILDLTKKKLAFAMLLQGFQFRKELMQEHFNEEYVQSDRYPKASFEGSFSGEGDLSVPGSHTIEVKGVLTLHGVSRPFITQATLSVAPGEMGAKSEFDLLPGDFNIKIPSVVSYKIASVIHVKVNVLLKPQ